MNSVNDTEMIPLSYEDKELAARHPEVGLEYQEIKAVALQRLKEQQERDRLEGQTTMEEKELQKRRDDMMLAKHEEFKAERKRFMAEALYLVTIKEAAISKEIETMKAQLA